MQRCRRPRRELRSRRVAHLHRLQLQRLSRKVLLRIQPGKFMGVLISRFQVVGMTLVIHRKLFVVGMGAKLEWDEMGLVYLCRYFSFEGRLSSS